MKLRKPRSRRGGAVATFIGIFILIMVILAIARAALQLLSPVPLDSLALNQNDCSSSGLNNGGILVKSEVRSELVDPSFWSLTLSDARIAAQQLPKETVLGYLSTSQEMKGWVRGHMQDPPTWLDTDIGSVIEAQIVNLQVHATATHDPIQAAKQILDFEASVAGYSLAALDYVTFGGITSLRALFDTGNPTAAGCASFPGQFSQMYNLALNGNMSRAERAQLLGKALVITSAMLVLGGTDGFTAKFKGALDNAGLATSWDRIKPYLGKIGSGISTHAAYLTTTLLEKLAQRFPLSQTWEMGFVSDRVDAMAEVLNEKSVSNDIIEQKIGDLIQAAGDTSSPEDIATDADSTSYDMAGGIGTRVGTENRLWLYSDADTMQFMPASYLQQKVPGFVEGQAAFLKVKYWEKDVTVYHYYTGGPNWQPRVPTDLAKPGDFLTITVSVLTREEFVNDLPSFNLGNVDQVRWMPDIVSLKSFVSDGNNMKVYATQDPEVEGISDFLMQGTASPLKSQAGITYLDFDMTDAFGNVRPVRISYDGHGPVSLGIGVGEKFGSVYFVSTDGVRLRFIYTQTQGEAKVATFYLGDPSVLYTLGETAPYQIPSDVSGTTSAFEINSVKLNRPLENIMLNGGTTYDSGRLGAEIAYTIAKEKLGLEDVVMNEPSQTGTDLYTTDGQVVIQARLLTATQEFASDGVQIAVDRQLVDLISQLRQDFRDHAQATTGYAILSYVDNDNVVKTIVLEVPKP